MRGKIIVSLIIIMAASIPVFSFSDQTTTERIINENKEYIEFMNYAITNFGKAQNDEFFQIYQLHFNAEVAYLQSDYKRAFRDVYKSQSYHDKLFDVVLTDYYLEHSKIMLDKLAPSIIKSKNKSARLYLTLGYRDRALSSNLQQIARATRPTLHSYRMHKYRDAIKRARRAMRYAMLALFESQDIATKKKIYDHLFEMERERGNPFYNRFLSKTDDGYLKEYHRDFENYEKEYSVELQKKIEKYESENENKSVIDAESENVYAVQFLFEKKVERRLRFKHEKRTAEYIRNADFDQANDIIRKYVDDFNFKLIIATIEVVQTSKIDNYAGLDFENLKVHHYDNYSRFYKSEENVLESYASKVRVVDDIDPKKNESSQNESQENASEEKSDETAEEN